MFTAKDVNLKRVQNELETLSQFGKQASGGINRFTFDSSHQQATNQVAAWMNDAGLDVYFDRWGNLYGCMVGFDNDAKCVLSGSHLDSVPHGGDYDGPLGVISALEAVRMVLESGAKIKRPLEVISFIEEEGTRFHGLLGSTLATGGKTDDEIASITDRDGNRFIDVLDSVQFPYEVRQNIDLRQRVANYIELHIEQGRRLQDAGIHVGTVTGIAGPNFMTVHFSGRSDHAGATAYKDRLDTLLAAAEVVIAVRQTGESKFNGKGHMTVGKLNVKPNATNVVAGETIFDVDFRAVDAETAVAMKEAVMTILSDTCKKHGIKYEIEGLLHSVAPMHSPQHIQNTIIDAAGQAGVEQMELVSWAAHDAMVMADFCDTGMIFTPCKDGRSHCPQEHVWPEDIAIGVAVLANALVQLASY
jgi:allantoate deiminase